MQTYSRKKQTPTLKFLLYYTLGVGAFIFLFTVYTQSSLFTNVAQKESSFAATTSRSYVATSGFNQDGNPSSDPYNSTSSLWLGNGSSRTASYLALTFPQVDLQNPSQISLATLQVTAKGGWVTHATRIYAEKNSNPQTFSKTSLPSSRSLTSASVVYTDSSNWRNGKTYSTSDLSTLLREIASGSSQNVVLILKGTGQPWGRRFIFPITSDRAPRLVIERKGSPGGSAVPTPLITPVPTSIPTARPVATPTTVPSTLPTAQPTTVTSAPGTLSMAMGKWTPSRFDSCTQAEHDSFSVIGPDGKRYPTWHPPTLRRADGTTCSFGHEHGRNPAGYAYWNDIRRHFAYDADKNGVISDAELASAGIPFGYVNEQIDAHAAHSGTPIMRHEDHVGHKIEFANGEGDIGDGTDPFDSNMTGGIVVPVKNPSGTTKWNPSGVRCYHFHKIHQGVSTPDALTNNIHEMIMHAKCDSTISQYPSSSSIISGMVAFGAPGEFTRFCPDNRTQVIKLGTTSSNVVFPGTTGQGQRNIITRDCVENTMLVTPGSFSSFPYEEWDGGLELRTSSGRSIASNGGAWEVLDAIRYYNPASPNRISYMADVCYEIIGNRQSRGGACDIMTNYRTLMGVTWDDPRSEFRGVKRGQYINAPVLSNSGGQTTLYTDPFGGNAQSTYFPGSVKQYVSAVNANLNGLNVDPRIILRNHDSGVVSGKSTVHAPN